jgi:hypothetical protein
VKSTDYTISSIESGIKVQAYNAREEVGSSETLVPTFQTAGFHNPPPHKINTRLNVKKLSFYVSCYLYSITFGYSECQPF